MIRNFLVAVLRRFCELLFCCVAPSFVLALLCLTGVLPDASVKMFAVVYVGVLVFFCTNTVMLRNCHYDIRNNRIYLAVNFVSYAVFVLLNLLAYKLLPQYIYTFFFAITKFAKFTPFPINSAYSAIIFHALMAIVIFLAPIGMKKIYEEEEAEILEEESLRPADLPQPEKTENATEKTETTTEKTNQ